MSYADRFLASQDGTFRNRVRMAVSATSEGLGLGVLQIPGEFGISLTQCGNLTRNIIANTNQYEETFAAAVVNYPAVSAVIDAAAPSQDGPALGALVTDDLITQAVFVNFLQLAAGFPG